jgi:hypothetical protein
VGHEVQDLQAGEGRRLSDGTGVVMVPGHQDRPASGLGIRGSVFRPAHLVAPGYPGLSTP